MSKKFGKILAFSAIIGAGIAIGAGYLKKYKKFHSEMDEDFSEFEDDLHHEEEQKKETQKNQEDSEVERKYVSIKLDSESLSATKNEEEIPTESKTLDLEIETNVQPEQSNEEIHSENSNHQ